MRRLLLALALIAVPGAALAAGWTAEMQEDEGGSVMVAYVTAEPDGAITPTLRLICAGSEGVMLRYEMPSDDGGPGSEADFLFENEHDQVKMHMVYEDMDGAFAAYFPKTDPVIPLLENGKDVFISEASGNYPAQSFSLKGSTKAIQTVLKGCTG
jgi:hypothetical protein